MQDIWEKLSHQSLGRALSASEVELASALEAIFAQGTHDFDAVCAALNAQKFSPPAGAKAWSAEVLQRELSSINASLDQAYEANGLGA